MIDTTKTYYLCGPMAGYPGHNYNLFREAAFKLRDMGYKIISPAELNAPPQSSDYPLESLKKDLLEIIHNAEGIIIMPGWEFSHGCNAEVNIAKALKIPIFPIQYFLRLD